MLDRLPQLSQRTGWQSLGCVGKTEPATPFPSCASSYPAHYKRGQFTSGFQAVTGDVREM